MLNKKDLFSLLIIALILFLYFLPAYTGLAALFNDDCMQQSFPRLVAVAKHIQNGEIPLWDNNTFSGAKGFYNVYESPIYNLFLYPFFLLADTGNLDQCYIVLYLIPFNLLMILAAFACYLIGRKLIKLDVLPSIAIGVIFALSPAFSISFDSLPNTSAHTFMVFMILGLAKLIEKQNMKWWLLSVLFTILVNLTFQFNYTIRIYFITGLTAFLLIVLSGNNFKAKLHTGLKVLSVFIFSFSLCMFVWSGILEGVLLIKETFLQDQASLDLNSMHPLALFTLLIPNFFGVNSGEFALGKNINDIWNADTLSGGLFAFFCLASCVYFLFKKNSDEKKMPVYRWGLISIILLIVSLISMLGSYTPVYKLLSFVLPFIFKIPHPVYFNSLQGLSMALCAGIGLNILMNNGRIKKIFFKNPAVLSAQVVLLFSVFIFAIISYITRNEDITFSSAFSILFQNKWFFSNPGIYFIISSVLLLLIIFIKEKQFFKYYFSVLVLIEGIYIGQQVLYERNELLLPGETDNYRNMILGNYHLPSDSPMYKVIDELKSKLKNEKVRFTGSISELDNLAWAINAKSLMAYDAKPIPTDMVDIINSYLTGFPYEMWTIKYPMNFLKNMSVSYIIAHDGIIDNETTFSDSNNGDFYFFQKNKDIINKYENNEIDYNQIFKSPKINIYKINNSMPYVYTQDKIIFEDNEEQKKKLLFEDLTNFACVYPDDRNILEKLRYGNIIYSDNNFKDLQNLNKIIDIDTKKANKISIEAEINKPSLMVINEMYHSGWNIKIDGDDTNLLKVNYMLQGFWINNGHHKIELTFFPASLKIGLIITLAALIIFIVIILYYLIRKIDP